MTADEPEGPDDRRQRLQCEWVEAEFSRLGAVYSPEGSVDMVSGALGPLFGANISIAGMPVEALVDPGSSATITSLQKGGDSCWDSSSSATDARNHPA